MKKVFSILISCLLITFISGCVPVAQLNEKLIAEGIGIDLSSDEKYEVTVHAIQVKGTEDQDSSAGEKIDIFRAKGSSVEDAMSNIKKQTGLEIMYWHTLLLVIGEELAKNGVEEIMGFFIKNNEFNPSAKILIAQGEAKDIFNLEINDEIVEAKKIASILQKGLDNSNRLNSNLRSFIAGLKCRYMGTIAGYVNTEELDEKTTLLVNKLAFLKENKLVGLLNDEESKGYLFIKGKALKVSDIMYSPDFLNVTYTVSKSKSKIKSYIENEKFKVLIDIKIKAYINEATINTRRDDDYKKIEKSIEARVKSLAEKAIKKAITDNETDIFGFSREFEKHYHKYTNDTTEIQRLLKEAEFIINSNVKVITIK